jgi:hypothetical protein
LLCEAAKEVQTGPDSRHSLTNALPPVFQRFSLEINEKYRVVNV